MEAIDNSTKKTSGMSETLTSQKPMKAWYVLRAISGKEAKVKELLEGAMRNTDLGNYLFQVLIPTEKVLTVRGAKRL